MVLSKPQMIRRAMLGAAMLVMASGCVGNPPPVVEGTVLVSVGPPPPRRDVRPRRPARDYIWIEGYYQWASVEYQWVPGHWERRPHGRAHWKKGRWYHSPRGWYWVDGHWAGR